MLSRNRHRTQRAATRGLGSQSNQYVNLKFGSQKNTVKMIACCMKCGILCHHSGSPCSVVLREVSGNDRGSRSESNYYKHDGSSPHTTNKRAKATSKTAGTVGPCNIWYTMWLQGHTRLGANEAWAAKWHNAAMTCILGAMRHTGR